MDDENPQPSWLLSLLGLASWTCVAATVAAKLDRSPWIPVALALGVILVVGVVKALAGHLSRLAGAKYLKRVETQNLKTLEDLSNA